jgi:bifunctional DNA-binding transcriptional regulator/antitoxin component of YhaV-PrlF toxin-antitoxin module
VREKVKARRRGLTRVSRKNQVTLPVAALAEANVRPGDELRVTVEGKGKILLSQNHDPLDEFIGALPGLSSSTDLEALRNEWGR